MSESPEFSETFTRNNSEPIPCQGRTGCPEIIVRNDPSTCSYIGDRAKPGSGHWVCKTAVLPEGGRGCLTYYQRKTERRKATALNSSIITQQSTHGQHQPPPPPPGPAMPPPAPPAAQSTPSAGTQPMQIVNPFQAYFAAMNQRSQNVDVAGIETASNRSHQRAADRPQVAALPSGFPPMFPGGFMPWMQASGMQSPAGAYALTPNVSVPNPWTQRLGNYNPHVPAAPPAASTNVAVGAMGYGPAHANYEAERRRRAKQAYARDNSENVDLLVTFAHEDARSKNKWAQISTIREGVSNVDAHSTPTEIIATAKSVIQRRVVDKKMFAGFPLKWNEMDVRTNPGFVNLKSVPQDTPFYLEQCRQEPQGKAAGKGVRVFKKPKTPFSLLVVMSAEHWDEWEIFEAQPEDAKPSNTAGHTGIATGSEKDTKKNKGSQFLSDMAYKRSRSASLEKSVYDAMHTSNRPRFDSRSGRNKNKKTDSESDGDSDDVVEVLRPLTPNKPRSPSPDNYVSPDHALLKKHLLEGGIFKASIHNRKGLENLPRRSLSYFRIPQLKLFALLEEHSSPQFVTRSANMEFGQIHFNSLEHIGMGASKTAHLGLLVSVPSVRNSSVVVKRVFVPQASDDTPFPPPRYTLNDETTITLIEANLLYWAYSLMDNAYEFIDSFIHSAKTECPLEIPRLRFVQAGYAVTDPLTTFKKKTAKSKSTAVDVEESMAILIEEYIDGDFVKYVHNASAANETGDSIGEFLCFIQHVQYWKTSRMAYISDFQGAGNLLTDPQIITSPVLAQAARKASGSSSGLFGSGNIQDAFEKFPEQHQCNDFCKWFEVPRLTR